MTIRDVSKRAAIAGVIIASSVIPLVGSPAKAALTNTSQTASVTTTTPSNCPRGYLCLYDGQRYSGRVLRLYYCGNFGLERWSYPGGGSWRDKARSVFNNQTGGADSVFYDTRNGSRIWVGSLEHPPSGFPTLSSNADRKIDFVHVC